MQRSILTMASGKAVYVNMAVNLARSFIIHHINTDIKFYIATDLPNLIPKDVIDNHQIQIIEFKEGAYGTGFSTKLHLDKIAPSEYTLFIDADCLLTGSLLPVFEKLKGKPVSVIGRPLQDGEWFGDVAHFCKQFNVKSIPGFNGCLYYIENSDIARKVYQKARELEPHYEEMGMVLLRGKPNDELLISVSMAIHGLHETLDDGYIYGDPLASPGKIKIDVMKGICVMENPQYPNPLHYRHNPFHITHPKICHFLGSHTEYPPYTTQAYILKKYFQKKHSVFIIRIMAFFKYDLPYSINKSFKNIFRPIYHTIMGTRKIKTSKRV